MFLLFLCLISTLVAAQKKKKKPDCTEFSNCMLTVILKDQTAKDKALQHMAAMSSAQIVSATAIHNKLGLPGIPRPAFPPAPGYWPGMIQTGPGSSQDVKPFVQQAYPIQPTVTAPLTG
ncbi:hypothetical protein AB205_0222230, partial [Aquarana catesbeiana]